METRQLDRDDLEKYKSLSTKPVKDFSPEEKIVYLGIYYRHKYLTDESKKGNLKPNYENQVYEELREINDSFHFPGNDQETTIKEQTILNSFEFTPELQNKVSHLKNQDTDNFLKQDKINYLGLYYRYKYLPRLELSLLEQGEQDKATAVHAEWVEIGEALYFGFSGDTDEYRRVEENLDALLPFQPELKLTLDDESEEEHNQVRNNQSIKQSIKVEQLDSEDDSGSEEDSNSEESEDEEVPPNDQTLQNNNHLNNVIPPSVLNINPIFTGINEYKVLVKKLKREIETLKSLLSENGQDDIWNNIIGDEKWRRMLSLLNWAPESGQIGKVKDTITHIREQIVSGLILEEREDYPEEAQRAYEKIDELFDEVMDKLDAFKGEVVYTFNPNATTVVVHDIDNNNYQETVKNKITTQTPSHLGELNGKAKAHHPILKKGRNFEEHNDDGTIWTLRIDGKDRLICSLEGLTSKNPYVSDTGLLDHWMRRRNKYSNAFLQFSFNKFLVAFNENQLKVLLETMRANSWSFDEKKDVAKALTQQINSYENSIKEIDEKLKDITLTPEKRAEYTKEKMEKEMVLALSSKDNITQLSQALSEEYQTQKHQVLSKEYKNHKIRRLGDNLIPSDGWLKIAFEQLINFSQGDSVTLYRGTDGINEDYAKAIMLVGQALGIKVENESGLYIKPEKGALKGQTFNQQTVDKVFKHLQKDDFFKYSRENFEQKEENQTHQQYLVDLQSDDNSNGRRTPRI